MTEQENSPSEVDPFAAASGAGEPAPPESTEPSETLEEMVIAGMSEAQRQAIEAMVGGGGQEIKPADQRQPAQPQLVQEGGLGASPRPAVESVSALVQVTEFPRDLGEVYSHDPLFGSYSFSTIAKMQNLNPLRSALRKMNPDDFSLVYGKLYQGLQVDQASEDFQKVANVFDEAAKEQAVEREEAMELWAEKGPAIMRQTSPEPEHRESQPKSTEAVTSPETGELPPLSDRIKAAAGPFSEFLEIVIEDPEMVGLEPDDVQVFEAVHGDLSQGQLSRENFRQYVDLVVEDIKNSMVGEVAEALYDAANRVEKAEKQDYLNRIATAIDDSLNKEGKKIDWDTESKNLLVQCLQEVKLGNFASQQAESLIRAVRNKIDYIEANELLRFLAKIAKLE